MLDLVNFENDVDIRMVCNSDRRRICMGMAQDTVDQCAHLPRPETGQLPWLATPKLWHILWSFYPLAAIGSLRQAVRQRLLRGSFAKTDTWHFLPRYMALVPAQLPAAMVPVPIGCFVTHAVHSIKANALVLVIWLVKMGH